MKKLIGVLILFFVVQNLFAQNQWQLQNPLPTGNTLRDCQYINENLVFAVGDYGTILKSTNSGVNWISINVNSTASFLRICFPDALTGYIVSTIGEKMKTTNGGDDWFTLGGGPYGGIADMDFWDANTGVIVGTPRIVYKTTNGGVNWVNIRDESTSFYYIKSVKMLSSINIMMGCNDASGTLRNMWIYDGSWHLQTQVPATISINDICISKNSPKVICACGPGTFLISKDFGATWVKKIPDSRTFTRVKSLDSNNAVLIGDMGILCKTSNGGDNWLWPSSIPVLDLLGIDLASSKGILVGQNGFSLITYSGGSGWSSNFFSLTFENLNFARKISNNRLVLFGNRSVVLSTTNAGNTWGVQGLGSSAHFTDAMFVDSLTGFSSLIESYYTPFPPTYVKKSYFYKSTNGSISWSLVNTKDNYFAYGINFMNNNTGVMCGMRQSVYKTTNGGNNWFNVYGNTNDTSKHLFKFDFVNEFTGYAVGTTGKIIKTTNSGSNWMDISMSITNHFYHVKFFNEQTGYVSGNLGNLFLTTNGGLNWNTTPETVPGPINSFHFFDVNNGYAVSNGVISFTSNGGISWLSQSIPSGNSLNSVIFTDTNTGFIVGSNGTIFKTTDGGGVFIYQISSEIPKDFSLSQNYPNPFNPSTKINYEIKSSGFVTLKVFDLLGKEVALLVNEKQNAGSYAVDFNSTEFNLPSGIYFYSLNAGEFKETKKMVLVK